MKVDNLLLHKDSEGECREKRKPRFRFDYAEPQPIFVLTKIARCCRGKWKSRLRFDYAEPQPIFVLTKIAKGECRGKRKSPRLRFDYADAKSDLRMYKDSESRKQKLESSLSFLLNKISSAGRVSHFSERKSTHIFSLCNFAFLKTVVSNNFKGYFQLL